MKNLNDIVYWLISTGTLGVVVKFAWTYIKPILEAKKKHTKAEKARAEWDFLEQVADAAVTAMVNQPKTGSDKFSTAVDTVTNAMAKQSMEVSQQAVRTAVQAAYEKSDLTNSNDPVMKAIETAPNRANDVQKEG